MFCHPCFKWNSYQVSRNPNYIAHIRNQTFDLCKQAVNQDPFAIKHVKLTGQEYDELCILALDKVNVADVVDIWKLIVNPSDAVKIKAVTKCPYIYSFLDEASSNVTTAMIDAYPKAICLVKEPTENMCLLAVRKRGDSLSDIKNQFEDICIVAVKENACNIQYVKVHTVSVYVAALTSKQLCQDGCLFQYTNPALMSVAIKQAIKLNPIVVQYVTFPQEDKNTEPNVGVIPNYYFKGALTPYLQCTEDEYIEMVMAAIDHTPENTETILEYVLDRRIREIIRRKKE